MTTTQAQKSIHDRTAQEARLKKAEADQAEADQAARKKETKAGGASTDPTVNLAAEGVGTDRTPGESPLRTLKPGHTHRDRVVAQAESLGIPVDETMSTEWVQNLIFMKASA